MTLARKTEKRDRKGWHTPDPSRTLPHLPDCEQITKYVGEDSLPEVGNHPSSEVVGDDDSK